MFCLRVYPSCFLAACCLLLAACCLLLAACCLLQLCCVLILVVRFLVFGFWFLVFGFWFLRDVDGSHPLCTIGLGLNLGPPNPKSSQGPCWVQR